MAHTDAELLLLPTQATHNSAKVVYELNAQQLHLFRKVLGAWTKQETRALTDVNIEWAKVTLEQAEP